MATEGKATGNGAVSAAEVRAQMGQLNIEDWDVKVYYKRRDKD